MPSERLRSLLRVLAELYRGEWTPAQALRFSGAQAAALHDLTVAFRGAGFALDFRGGERLRARGEAIARGPRARVEPPPDLRATLRPYQAEGLAFLQHLRDRGVGGILADDMGLGKTLQTIAHFALEKASGRLVHPALVVAPTSLVGTWIREVGKFAPSLRAAAFHGPGRRARWAEVRRADVIVTSYPLLVRDEALLAAQRYHLLVLDEAQTVKNYRSQAARAVRALEADHRLCLTGTPVENHLGELWSLVDFVDPGLLGDEAAFSRFYRAPIERLGDEERLDALRGLLAPYILRRRKDQVAKDLPPKTELLRPVELTGKQRELYESIRISAHGAVRKIIERRGLAASTPSILGALMKLRQVCCDPRLLPMEAARFVRESAKYELCFELLERQLEEGHRVLVFSQFTSMLGLIAEGLRARGTRFVALTGTTTDRQKVVDTFEKGDAEVFLISLKAGGTGLTLTSADTVIHYDPWWNPAAQAQATDRAYRIGQTKPVFVHSLFVAGSVEERILALQQRKQHLADAILGATASRPTLTEDDVDVLFAPLGA